MQAYLELRVALQSVGVVSVPRVVRAYRGLRVAHVPGLGPQHAQEGGGVHRAGADLRDAQETSADGTGRGGMMQAGR